MQTELHSLLDIVFRSTCVYLFMVFAFRIFGKRELAQLSTTDLVLIVLISNAVQNAMVGNNVTLIGGLTASTVLFLVNLLLGYLMYKFKGFKRIIQSDPVMLIYDGKVIDQHMHATMLTYDELMAAIREHGVKDIHDVSLAMLEVDGNISVISTDDEDRMKRTQYKRKRQHKTIQDM